jgi:phenylpropionate dioxygenase-like ring-hydroxylating dioxygenase large terminal subunit
MNDPDATREDEGSRPKIDPASIPLNKHLLKEVPPYNPRVMRVPVERYFEKKYHDMEVENIWKKAWQWACREEEIPEIGDHIVYEVANLSFIVIRTGEAEFKAYWNSCLHRGRKLCDFDGKRATELRCMFHGWAWNIDGTMRNMTCGWDFPGTREEVTRLPEAKTGTWGGFVFINPDPNCETLEEFLGELPEYLDAVDKFRDRWKQAHVQAVLPCNWKVSQEAFLEGWHVHQTHPQLLYHREPGMSGGHRWDDFGNWMRFAPSLPTDQHRAPSDSSIMVADTPQRAIDSHFETHLNEDPRITAVEGESANRTILREVREWYRSSALGDDVDKWNDFHLIGTEPVSVWPNFHPWAGLSHICYRFRPYKDDPNQCLMDVALLSPWPSDAPRPPPAPVRRLQPDETIADAPEIGVLARIFMQDIGNMVKVHEGLKTSRQGYVIISQHQEAQVRHFYDLYEKWMGLEDESEAIGTR